MSNATTNTSTEVTNELARLRAENEALKAKEAKRSTLSIKVSEKGGVSVYGLGRFPVTLYAQQWERLIGLTPEITAFITANKAKLTFKE